MGDGPCIRPPNILRSTVMGCEAKYELTKKRCHKGMFLSEIELLVKKAKFQTKTFLYDTFSLSVHICYISDFR